MKFLFAVITAVFCAQSAFAEVRFPEDSTIIEDSQLDEGLNRGHAPQPEVTSLVGKWIAVRSSCASGAPVRDRVFFERDFMQLNFEANGHYWTFSDVDFCRVQSDGYYYERSGQLIMDVMSQQSSCAPSPRLPLRLVYQYRYNKNSLFLRTGPLNGGPCPAGDYYDLTYRRL